MILTLLDNDAETQSRPESFSPYEGYSLFLMQRIGERARGASRVLKAHAVQTATKPQDHVHNTGGRPYALFLLEAYHPVAEISSFQNSK